MKALLFFNPHAPEDHALASALTALAGSESREGRSHYFPMMQLGEFEFCAYVPPRLVLTSGTLRTVCGGV